MFKRSLVFLYGILSYAVFFGVYLYAIGFVGNFLVPRSIDSAAEGSFIASLVIDLALLLAFAMQHSVMARPAFKRWWTRIVPEPAERSTPISRSGWIASDCSATCGVSARGASAIRAARLSRTRSSASSRPASGPCSPTGEGRC